MNNKFSSYIINFKIKRFISHFKGGGGKETIKKKNDCIIIVGGQDEYK